MDDDTAGGCLGMFLLFPAVGMLVLGAIYGSEDSLLIGTVFAVVFLGVWFWLGRDRGVLKAAALMAAAFLVLGAIGFGIISLSDSPGIDPADCDTGPLATRC
jgi:hypothetical protein